jgi:hypothetical protein
MGVVFGCAAFVIVAFFEMSVFVMGAQAKCVCLRGVCCWITVGIAATVPAASEVVGERLSSRELDWAAMFGGMLVFCWLIVDCDCLMFVFCLVCFIKLVKGDD